MRAVPRKQRRVAVDMAVLEGGELGEDAGIAVEHAGEIHHLGEADHLGMVAKGQQVVDLEPGAGGLERGRGHAGGEVDADIHDGALGAIEEIADALGAQHIGDLVRVADDRGDAMRQHAAVEFERGDQRGFDVQMGVDEAGHGEAARRRRSLRALIGRVGADDAVGDDGDVGVGDGAGDDVEQADILDDQVGGLVAAAGCDHLCEHCGVGHAVTFVQRRRHCCRRPMVELRPN